MAPPASTTAAPANRNTFNRPDTFFGVCEAIGQDFGFNPLWLRLAFVPPIFFQPAYAFAAYAVLALVVLASRMMFPAKSEVAAITAPTLVAAVPAPQPVEPADARLPLAA